jgi:hypothetical protein
VARGPGAQEVSAEKSGSKCRSHALANKAHTCEPRPSAAVAVVADVDAGVADAADAADEVAVDCVAAVADVAADVAGADA